MLTNEIRFNLKLVHPSWHECLKKALESVNDDYLETLARNNEWLPGRETIFNAFSIPLQNVHYILLGESPYPRKQSANGFAFWDQSVQDIWSQTGFSKQVNRATSLRNIIKTLLVAENALSPNSLRQEDIAKIDKTPFVKTNDELFHNFINRGFLLLNASLVLQSHPVRKDAIAWQPFIKCVLHTLFESNPKVQLILLGNIAATIDKLIEHSHITRLYAEHPYNISFIHNPKILEFFKPLHLLLKNEKQS